MILAFSSCAEFGSFSVSPWWKLAARRTEEFGDDFRDVSFVWGKSDDEKSVAIGIDDSFSAGGFVEMVAENSWNENKKRKISRKVRFSFSIEEWKRNKNEEIGAKQKNNFLPRAESISDGNLNSDDRVWT